MSTAVSSSHRQRPTPSITIATRGKGRSFKARASWYFTTATNTKRSAADNQHQVHHQQAEALVVGRPQLPRTRGRRLVPGSGSKPTPARVLRAHPAPELKATAKRAGRSRSVGHPSWRRQTRCAPSLASIPRECGCHRDENMKRLAPQEFLWVADLSATRYASDRPNLPDSRRGQAVHKGPQRRPLRASTCRLLFPGGCTKRPRRESTEAPQGTKERKVQACSTAAAAAAAEADLARLPWAISSRSHPLCHQVAARPDGSLSASSNRTQRAAARLPILTCYGNHDGFSAYRRVSQKAMAASGCEPIAVGVSCVGVINRALYDALEELDQYLRCSGEHEG